MKNLVILCFLLLCCCSEDDDDSLAIVTACEVDNPLEQLTWLSEQIRTKVLNQTEFSEYDFITQGKFNSETVFLFKNCNPIANSVVPVLDCQGIMLGLLSLEIPQEEIFEETLIWKNAPSSCDLTVFGD